MFKSQMQLLFLTILVILDFVTGVRKSLKSNGVSSNPLKKDFWRVVSSKGMRETWNKAYQYGFGILIMIAVQVLFFGEETFEILNAQFSIVKAGMFVLCGIEIYSIFENLTATGKITLINKMEDVIIRVVKVFKGQKTE